MIITNENFLYNDLITVDLYKCPECEFDDVIEDSRYCPNCGEKIEWKLEV